jgi:hypothetical protein
MGCQISHQGLTTIKISLNANFFKQGSITRTFQRWCTISFIVKELKSEHLKDDINPNKLKIRVSYMRKLYSGSCQQTLYDLNIKDNDEIKILCKLMEYETVPLQIQAPNSSRKILMNVSKVLTISKLVDRLKRSGLFWGNFQLSWKGVQLEDINLIDSYNIEAGDTIYITNLPIGCERNLEKSFIKNVNFDFSTDASMQGSRNFSFRKHSEFKE